MRFNCLCTVSLYFRSLLLGPSQITVWEVDVLRTIRVVQSKVRAVDSVHNSLKRRICRLIKGIQTERITLHPLYQKGVEWPWYFQIQGKLIFFNNSFGIVLFMLHFFFFFNCVNKLKIHFNRKSFLNYVVIAQNW